MKTRMKKIISYKGPIKNAPSDYRYWITRPYEERLSAVELLREQFYDKVTPRLQRVYTITKRKRS